MHPPRQDTSHKATHPKRKYLGLDIQLATPQTHTTKQTLLECLEEVVSNQANENKHPARSTIEKYTPGPMPPIQDATLMSIFSNIDLTLLKEWDNRQGGKCLVIPFDPDVRAPESHDFYCSRILTAITDIITTQEASVAAPRPSKDTRKKNKTPTSFLIYNITHEQATFLLERRVWSSKAITFRVAPFKVSCPTFLFAIKHLSTLDPKDVYPIVRGVWESEKMKQFTKSLTLELPENEQPRIAYEIDFLLLSMNLRRLDIKEVGNNLCPRFNVYADCGDFSNDEIWERLRTFLCEEDYISPMEAIPATTEKIPFVCNCCHGVDHPRGLCPFPSLPRWNSPKVDHAEPHQRRNGGHPSGPSFSNPCQQRQIFSLRN